MMPNCRRISVALLLCLCVLLVPIELSFAQKWGKISEEEKNMGPPEEFPDADAVVLFDKGELKISADDIIVKRHVRVKVFHKDGAEDAANVDLGFFKSDNIRELKAHTITPDGKKKKVKDTYEKESGSRKNITFAFPAVEDGAILEYRYRVIHHRYGFLDTWYFQSEIPTLESEFSVIMFPGFKYNVSRNHVPSKFKKPVEKKFPELGVELTQYTWNLKDLPAAKDEPVMGAASTYLISIRFQLLSYGTWEFLKSWGDIGEAYAKDIEDFAPNRKEIAKLADSICANSQSKSDEMRDMYRFVRDEIETRGRQQSRYFDYKGAVELLENMYGSAGEKNLFLVELFRSRHISAYPLFIGTRGYSRFNPALRQLSQFNHMVCYVDTGDGGFALDTGQRSVTYPYLPSYDLVAGGLLLDGTDSRTTSLTHAERKSGVKLESIITLIEDGSAICTTRVCVTGYEMANYDEFLGDSLSQIQIIDEFLEDAAKEYEVVSQSSRFDTDRDSLHLEIVLELAEFAETVGDNLFFSPILLPIEHNPFTSQDRFFPVDFRYPYNRFQAVTVKLPDGMEIADMPSDINHRISDASYSRMSLWNAGCVNVVENFRIEKSIFSPGEYLDLKGVFDMMTESSMDQLAASVGP